MTAGLTINDALSVAARTLDNTWFESRLQRMRSDLARGSSISAAARNMGVLVLALGVFMPMWDLGRATMH
jgi:type II secretory pathway component PulF